MGAAKALMNHLGVPVGGARLPNLTPSTEQTRQMIAELERVGFFGWV